jgi:hypothetical protein
MYRGFLGEVIKSYLKITPTEVRPEVWSRLAVTTPVLT